MKKNSFDFLLSTLVCLLCLSMVFCQRAAAISAIDVNTQAFATVRKTISLDYYQLSNGSYKTKLVTLPLNGLVEYYDVVAGDYKSLPKDLEVPTTILYYTSVPGFAGTDSFKFVLTETVGTTVTSATRVCRVSIVAPLFANDWPMFRQNHHLYGETSMVLPETLHLQWIREYPALKSAWSLELAALFDEGYYPVVSGKTMYVASNRNDSLVALDADTGTEKWRFYADGPIRFAPVAINGKVYLGSDDGYVYCLNGATGAEVWKFRGGPAERRVFGNERMISTWPVRGAPVFYGGKIYFASGLWPWEGIFVYALNADTGAVIWKNDCGGHETPIQPHSGHAVSGIAPQGYCVIKNTLDKLIVPCGHAMPAYFDLITGKLDPWNQGMSRGQDGADYAIDATGKPLKTINSYLGNWGFPIPIAVGSRVYTTGPGVTGVVHNLIAADNKLFVTTKEGRIYCFGGSPVSSPKTWTTPIVPLPTITDTWTSDVAQMISQVGLNEGYCMVWGIGSGRLVEELVRQSKFKIDVYDPDAAKVSLLRQKLEAAGLYGTRIAAHAISPMNVEFPPYMARLIASENPEAVGFSSGLNFTGKLFTALRPYGGTAWLPITVAQHATFGTSVANLGSTQAVLSRNGDFSLLLKNGRLPGTTDFLNASAKVQSQDQLVKPPFAAQWYSDVYYFGNSSSLAVASVPDVVDGLMIAPNGKVYDVYTGLPLTISRAYSGTKSVQTYGGQQVGQRTNPFNGKTEDRVFYRAYGCPSHVVQSFGELITCRSGNPAYYHIPTETGPVNIGGMRPGCGQSGQVPANGLYVIGGQVGCACDYPLRTSLALVHRPDGEQFTLWQDRSQQPLEEDPIRKIGVNFGAPGDRMAGDKVLWLHRPAILKHAPIIPMQMEPSAAIQTYTHHASFIKAGNSPQWVASSGVKGINSFKVNLAYPNLTAFSGTPVIDGNLGDTCWDGKGVIELFNPGYRASINPKLQGQVYLRYDASNLYIACNYFGSDPASLYKGPAAWDLFLTDRLQFNKKYVHYRVDHLGGKYDSLKIFPGTEDSAWIDSTWISAHSTTANSFKAEISISWATLASLGLDRNSLALNVQGPRYEGASEYLQLRSMPSAGEPSYWTLTSPTICNRFCPIGFGNALGDLGKTRTYTVRMHFAEPDNLTVGQRVFDIGLQGATLASNFDIVAAAGGIQKSVVKEFVNVQIKDLLDVSFVPKAGVPVISGLEIFETGASPMDVMAPSIPSGLVATTASSSQINLNWTASTDNVGVLGYKIYRNGSEVASTSGITYSDAGLASGTVYNYKVAAMDAAGNLSLQSSQASATTSAMASDTTPPTIVLTSPAAGAVSGSVTLSANASDNVAIVGVQFKVDGVNIGAEDVSAPYSVSWNSSTATTGRHAITAVARDAAGNSKVSDGVNVSTISSDGVAPIVSITSPAHGTSQTDYFSVLVNASDNVGIVGVQLKMDGANYGPENSTLFGGLFYLFIITGDVLPAGNRTFTAVARDAAGNSSTSAPVVVTLGGPLNPPTSLFAAFGSGNQIRLDWNDRSTAETGFRIERKMGSAGVYTLLSTVAANVRSYTDLSIVAGNKYFYRVCAVNGVSSSAYSNEASPVMIIQGALAGGSKHSVALKDDGTVWTWGSNAYAQLGIGSTNSPAVPTQVPGLSGVVEVCAGDLHTLALKSDGTLWAWGYNSSGQLGDATSTSRWTPIQISVLAGVQSMDAGAAHSVALKSDGTVWTWGKNASGQLGDGTIVTRKAPVKVLGLPSITSVASGSAFTVASAQDGSVWTWGANNVGQLGDGSLVQSLVPIKVNGVSNIVRVAAGINHVLALKSDGTIWAWGYNSSGQLGNGTKTASSVPIQVSGAPNAIDVACGGNHSLAISAQGLVYGWGDNGQGQLGSIGTPLTPLEIYAGVSPVGISGGSAHTLILLADGSVSVTGDNNDGQLGLGTWVDQKGCVSISGLDLIAP